MKRFEAGGGVGAGFGKGRGCVQMISLFRAICCPKNQLCSTLFTLLQSSEDSCMQDFVMTKAENLFKILLERE